MLVWMCKKAFDKVNHFILFEKLMKCNVPMCPLQVLRWNSCVSRLFSFTCGASRWSPFTYTLFAVYVDDLIRKLVEPGLGCSVGSENIGCLFYADDIVLLSWSLGLSANCKIC